ncbi:MAG: cobalamin B12-binding domain-containing protein [Fibrobacterota bacterium]
MNQGISQEMYDRYFSYLLKGDRKECMKIVSELFERGIEVRELYTDLFQTSLYQIGKLWEQNKISVAREHMATAITENAMLLAYPHLFGREDSKGKVIISCLVNEFHQVGAKMIADILELNGWSTRFLGANTPLRDLLSLIDEDGPDAVGLSMSIYSHMPRLAEVIDTLVARYPRLPILVGGQAFRFGGTEMLERYDTVTFLSDIPSLEKWIGTR